MSIKINSQRKSSIELLKLLAMALIVLFHASMPVPEYIDYETASSCEMIGVYLLNRIGQLGNNIFIVSSSWFLIGKNNDGGGSIRYNKIIKILLDSISISIIIYICFILFSDINFEFSVFIKQLLPDIYNNLWFIPTYAIFYLIYPYLNKILSSIRKKDHFVVCCVSYFVFAILGIFNLNQQSSNLTSFINIYFLVAYFKKYLTTFNVNIKINLFLALFLIIVYFSILIFANNELNWNDLFNPIITLVSIFIFNFFNGIDINGKIINYLSSCTLFVYCIHENILLRTITRVKYYDYMITQYNKSSIISIIACFVMMLLSSFALSIIYKETISKFTNKLSYKIYYIVSIAIEKII